MELTPVPHKRMAASGAACLACWSGSATRTKLREADGEAIEPPGDSTASTGSSLASTNSNVLLLGFVVFALFFNALRHV